MTKMIYRKIEECKECPYADYDHVWDTWECIERVNLSDDIRHGDIENLEIVQDYCPLPDAPEGD